MIGVDDGDLFMASDAGGGGAISVARKPTLFRIVSGSNPYEADEYYLDETDGSRSATGGNELTAAHKMLYEVNGNAKVKPGRVVIGFPNPAGAGFFFDADGLAPTARIPIDFCVVKSGGNVTDIRVTWLNADGTTECETVPECSGGGCDDLWWCTTAGVVSLPAGTEPDAGDYYSGPYTSYADALAACDDDSGGPGEPGGGDASCCADQTLNSRLFASLDGGHGTATLEWDGSRWAGSKALSCGETLYLRYGTTCGLSFSCDGVTFVPTGGGFPPAIDCGPPFSDTSGYTCDMNDGGAGCAGGLCGTVTVTEVAE